jgi:hypothetical protein
MPHGEESWTTEEELFLTNLEKQCNDYYKHNVQEYTYYNGMSSKFNIPILVVSALNALCAIALNDFLSQKFVSILNAILSAGTGILGSIQLYMKLNEKMTNSLRASINFKKLALKISKELTIARKDRTTEGQTFLADCFSEFNTVLEQGNPIEVKIRNHMAYLTESVEKEPSTPLRRVADRFIKLAKSVTPSAGSVNSFEDFRKTSMDELRKNNVLRMVGTNMGSGGGTPESEP